MHKLKVYKCTDCDQRFETLIEKDLHQKVTHLVHKCDECFENFENSKNLKKHMIKSHNSGQFKCDICGKEFDMRTKYRQHKINHNSTIVCDLCGCKCSSPANLKQHMRKHTGEKPFEVFLFFDIIDIIFTISCNLICHIYRLNI